MIDEMKHMNFVSEVRQRDIDLLKEKEKTYQGSWKKAGGRSAWFMLRRNMDRLMVMMSHVSMSIPVSDVDTKTGRVSVDFDKLQSTLRSEDIFAKIEEHPDGEDGTVLACIRDLRCYLTLVEAEMIARGVVKSEVKIKEIGLYHDKIIVDNKIYEKGKEPRPAQFDTGNGVVRVNDIVQWGAIEVTVEDIFQDGEAEISYVFDGENKKHVKIVKWSALTPLGDQKQATPEDGGQHESLFPYVVDKPHDSVFWRRMGQSDQYIIEHHVMHSNIPKMLYDIYVSVTGTKHLILDMAKVPQQIRSMFPVLRTELNAVEHGELPFWQSTMYDWSITSGKYVINSRYRAWTEVVED